MIFVAIASLGGFAALWHVLPLLVWHLHLRPELAAQANGHRLRVPHRTDFELPERRASQHAYAGVEVSAVFIGDVLAPCGDDTAVCRWPIDGGILSISRTPPGESHGQMVNLRAPDERDLSFIRSAAANWATMRALRERVTTSRADLDSWRYSTPGSRGIVAVTKREGNTRYVIAAYPHDDGRPRMIGVVSEHPDAVYRIIGSIRL